MITNKVNYWVLIAIGIILCSCGSFSNKNKPANELILGSWVLEDSEIINFQELKEKNEVYKAELKKNIKEMEETNYQPDEGEMDIEGYKEMLEGADQMLENEKEWYKKEEGKIIETYNNDKTYSTTEFALDKCPGNYELSADGKTMNTLQCANDKHWEILELTEDKFVKTYIQEGTYEAKWKLTYKRKI